MWPLFLCLRVPRYFSYEHFHVVYCRLCVLLCV
jgi:hypothetical protein